MRSRPLTCRRRNDALFRRRLLCMAATGAALVAAFWGFGDGQAAGAEEETNQLPLITTGRQLIDLPPKECARHYPVRVRGTITYFDAAKRTMFALDETSGFWVFPTWQETNRFEFGDVVEVTGVSEGPNVSAVRPGSVRLLGRAALPAATPVTYERMAGGQVDCQWLELEGVVRTMAYDSGLLRVVFVTENQRVPLYLPDFEDKPLPTYLVGARVRARGVCSMRVTPDRHIIGAHLMVQNLESLSVVETAPTNAFDTPLKAVNELSLYGTHVEYGERVKVQGTVTLWRPGGDLYIRDGESPLAIRLRQRWRRFDPHGRYHDPPASPALKLGDQVEVVGYPALAAVLMTLDDAEYRLAGSSSNQPAPRAVQAEDAVAGALHGELISVEGTVLAHESLVANGTTTELLSIQSGQRVVDAELVGAKPQALTVARNARVRLTGIDTVQLGTWNQPVSFRLLLRSPGDVLVIRPPPRWTLQLAARLGAVAAGMMLLGTVWIVVLRRRVAARTESLRTTNDQLKREIGEREQVEHELRCAQQELSTALEKERGLHELKSNFVNLVSHEFRTPLSIILSSTEILSSYLHALKEEQRAMHLKDIKESTCYMADLVEDVLMLGRVEAGKIQFLPTPMEVGQFCRRLVDEISSATSHRCPIELCEESVEGEATGDEGLLRHIFSNLLSNAVKYSPPGRAVQFRVKRSGEEAVFEVRDQGIGIPDADLKRVFTAFHRGANVGQFPGTGLGLFIVNRCVEMHHGRIQIESAEGTGTTVTVCVPLFGKTHSPKPPRPAEAVLET